MAIGSPISDLRAKFEARGHLKAAALVSAVRTQTAKVRKLVTLALIRDWFEEDSNDFRKEFTSQLDSLESPEQKNHGRLPVV